MTYTPTVDDVKRAARHFKDFEMPRPLQLSCAKAILATHHAELERQGWQVVRWEPIETAPHDGTQIIIAGAGLPISVGRFLQVAPKWRLLDPNAPEETNSRLDTQRQTHWMSLPKPPGEKS